MNSIRKASVIVAGIIAMGAGATAFAGVTGKALEKFRSGGSDSGQSQSAPSPAPQYSAPSAPQSSRPSAPQAAPQPRSSEPRTDFRNSERLRAAPGPRPQSQPNAAQSPARPAESGNRNNSRNDGSRIELSGNEPQGRDRGVVGGSLLRNFRGNPGNTGGGNGDHGNHRPPRVVYTLPPGYRDYYWGGSRYYNFGGSWYSPYGSSYISIGAPYGLFVSSLPGYSTSFYYGDMRYYRYDDTYYTYDTSRRGYVVSRSPYGDEEDYYYDEDVQPDKDLYIYPAQGQSETQQADDRYACHRWSVKESSYDPIDDDYDRSKHDGYTRAMTACLTGRGYSVR